MNNKYKGVLSPQYKSTGGLLGAMFAPLLQGEVTITSDKPVNEFTEEQDPQGIYRMAEDRAWTEEEDPQGIYKGTLKKGYSPNNTQTMTLAQFLGGK